VRARAKLGEKIVKGEGESFANWVFGGWSRQVWHLSRAKANQIAIFFRPPVALRFDFAVKIDKLFSRGGAAW
jgi:hypothetical protein